MLNQSEMYRGLPGDAARDAFVRMALMQLPADSKGPSVASMSVVLPELGKRHPVVLVGSQEAVEFINKLVVKSIAGPEDLIEKVERAIPGGKDCTVTITPKAAQVPVVVKEPVVVVDPEKDKPFEPPLDEEAHGQV